MIDNFRKVIIDRVVNNILTVYVKISSTKVSTLAKVLQKYFTRKGNRILFANGMTLNQLALEMWERLDYQGVDASVLSRVLNGERLFSKNQLEIFCKVLNLSTNESERLKGVLYGELSTRFGFSEDFIAGRNRFFASLVKDNIDKIRECKDRGSLSLASDWGDQVYERIQSELNSNLDGKTRNKLLGLLAQLLIEMERVILETNTPSELCAPVKALSKELGGIGETLGDRNLVGVSKGMIGNMLYIVGQYHEAQRTYKQALKLTTSKMHRAISLRAAVLSLAYLQRKSEYKVVKKDLVDIMSCFPLDFRATLLEGIARSEAILGLDKESQKTMSSAWDVHDAAMPDGSNVVHSKLQLVRSEVECAKILGKRSKNYIEKIGREGIILARQLGYKRYEKIIRNDLVQFLN